MKSLTRYFGYSRCAYYKSIRAKEAIDLEENKVLARVCDIRRSQPRIGVKKLYAMLKQELKSLKKSVGRDRLFAILRKRGLLIKRKRKYVTTTQSWHRYHKYKNKLSHKILTGPNQALVNDITYLRTRKGFVYLFLQTDAWSRKVTGWSLSESLAIEGAIRAMRMTIKQNPGLKGCIHHSDRGIQYCCKEYVKLLKRYKIEISMTEKNHCYENSMAERVNGILKQDFLLDYEFDDTKTALMAVKEAIYTYNNHRPHWSLDLLTPEQVHQAA